MPITQSGGGGDGFKPRSSYTASMDIYAGDYKDVADCGLIIITAGANQKPGETRLDLIEKNVGILKSIVPQITATAFEGILMIVANPVVVLTYAAQQISGYPVERVFGSGTVLDTARLKYQVGRHLDVDSRSVHAVIIGEHGDSELPVWSGANVSGIDLNLLRSAGSISTRGIQDACMRRCATAPMRS